MEIIGTKMRRRDTSWFNADSWSSSKSLDEYMSVNALWLEDGELTEQKHNFKRNVPEEKKWHPYSEFRGKTFYSTEGDKGAKLAVVRGNKIKFIPIGESPPRAININSSYHSALGQIRADFFNHDPTAPTVSEIEDLENRVLTRAKLDEIIENRKPEYMKNFGVMVDIDRSVLGILEAFINGIFRTKYGSGDVKGTLGDFVRKGNFANKFFEGEFDSEEGFKLRGEDFKFDNGPQLGKIVNKLRQYITDKKNPLENPGINTLYALKTCGYDFGTGNVEEKVNAHQTFIEKEIIPKVLHMYVASLYAINNTPNEQRENNESFLALSRLNRMAKTTLDYFKGVPFSYENPRIDNIDRTTVGRYMDDVFGGYFNAKKSVAAKLEKQAAPQAK